MPKQRSPNRDKAKENQVHTKPCPLRQTYYPNNVTIQRVFEKISIYLLTFPISYATIFLRSSFTASTPTKEQRRLETKTVVLIDDDKGFTTHLSTLINSYAEYSLSAVSHSGRDGTLAIEYYRPDIVILDIMMPDSDGLTVLRYIRANCKKLNPYIYIITAMETPVVKAILEDFEVDFVTFKPLVPSAVDGVLGNIITLGPKLAVREDVVTLKNVVDYIVEVLEDFQMPSHLVGYEYTKAILIYMFDDPTLKRNVYAKVATVYGANKRSVAANINNAIKACSGSKVYKAEFGQGKAETLLFLNRLSSIVKKRIRGGDDA